MDGSFYVADPKPQLLEQGGRLQLRGAEVRIAARKGTDQRPIIRLEHLENRSAVEPLRGEQLFAARDDAPALDEDEWWEEDLEGCSVLAGGQLLGSVRRLVALPSCEALEVARPEGGGDLLVPLVSDAVLSVDIARREIEVDLGFLGES